MSLKRGMEPNIKIEVARTKLYEKQLICLYDKHGRSLCGPILHAHAAPPDEPPAQVHVRQMTDLES